MQFTDWFEKMEESTSDESVNADNNECQKNE